MYVKMSTTFGLKKAGNGKHNLKRVQSDYRKLNNSTRIQTKKKLMKWENNKQLPIFFRTNLRNMNIKKV